MCINDKPTLPLKNHKPTTHTNSNNKKIIQTFPAYRFSSPYSTWSHFIAGVWTNSHANYVLLIWESNPLRAENSVKCEPAGAVCEAPASQPLCCVLAMETML